LTTGTGRGSRRRPHPARALASVLVVVATVAVTGGAAAASPPPAASGAAQTGTAPPPSGPTVVTVALNTFAFDGALSGTLRVDPRAGCQGAGPAGVTLQLEGTLKGASASAWTVQVLSLANGTYKLHPGSVVGVSLFDSDGDLQWGLVSEGTLTVRGTSGAVDAQLSSPGNSRSLHVVGQWDCPPG
jgi:hypothetical protein